MVFHIAQLPKTTKFDRIHQFNITQHGTNTEKKSGRAKKTAPRWGSRFCPSPAGCSRQLKNGSRYRHETFSTFSSIKLTFTIKISEKNPSRNFRNWRFSDVMVRDFGSKSGICLRASRMHRFEIKHNPLTPKGAKSSVLQNVFLRFFYICPRISKFSSFRNKCL